MKSKMTFSFAEIPIKGEKVSLMETSLQNFVFLYKKLYLEEFERIAQG